MNKLFHCIGIAHHQTQAVRFTSAWTLQNSASLALFTSQLMTRTSGRQRMLRVCTCGSRECTGSRPGPLLHLSEGGGGTHRRLILLTVLTPGLGALLQTDALLQDLGKVVLLYFIWWIKVNWMRCQRAHFLPPVNDAGWFCQAYYGDLMYSLCWRLLMERTLESYLESCVRGNAWWTAALATSGPSLCRSDTDCCSPPHSRTVSRWPTHQRNPENWATNTQENEIFSDLINAES